MMNNSNITIAKQKIMEVAADLFAKKGYTETSVRELADAAGISSSALYYHFPSKNAVLELILTDYTAHNIDVFEDRNVTKILAENPTADGMLSCLQIAFPPERINYYLNVLCVLLQEQLRIPIVGDYVSEHIVLRAERNVKKIIDVLKELGVIRQDIDPDYWQKITSCLFYSFAVRRMLGIGDNTPNFSGMGMVDMLKQTFAIMLDQCGAGKAGDER